MTSFQLVERFGRARRHMAPPPCVELDGLRLQTEYVSQMHALQAAWQVKTPFSPYDGALPPQAGAEKKVRLCPRAAGEVPRRGEEGHVQEA